MTEITEVPSPFCGIGADDLTVQVDGLAVHVTYNGCAVTTPLFEQPVAEVSPRIGGKAADLSAAAAKAAVVLKDSRQPVIGGCATDVNGMRAILSLADRIGAVVDNMNFSAARNNILALQDSGWMNTTLAEVKNRCDFLLAVGADVEAFAPRFFERHFWTDEALFLPDPKKRIVVYLGKAPSGAASTSPNGQAAQVLVCEQDALPEVVAVLRALLNNRPVQAGSVAGLAVSDLRALAEQLKAASYGVVTWGAGALNYAHAELTVQMISALVKDVNALNTRCSGLPLAGKEGDQTANQVCAWTTGYPARTRFSRGYPEYDPYLNDCRFLLASGEADALVWVQAFNAQSAPPATHLPTIVIGRSGMKFEQEPAVFIPVGTPGIDHAGHAYRMDNVVAIRLKKLRESGLPSTADVLTAIENAL
jgi:formylmethanofuran dehydrogenase subunit B